MAKFENMTLSYNQIASIPFQTRKSASGSLLDALSRDLTPGQRVALFPSYVNQIYASGGVKDGDKVNPPEGGGGGSSDVPPTVEKAGPPRPGKGLTTTREIIPGGLIFGPDGKPMRVPDQQKIASLKDVGDGQKLPIETRMAIVQKSIEEQLKRDGYKAKDIKKVAAAFTGQVMAESTFDPNAMHDKSNGVYTGYGIYGARLERRDAMLAWMAAEGYEKNSLVGQARFMAHEAVTVPEYNNLMKDLSEMTDVGDMTLQVGKWFEKPQNIYDSIETRRNAAAQAATIDLSGLDEEGGFSSLDNVYDMNEDEIKEATSEPIAANAAISYDELRSEYPDIIDEDSSIWDRIDPALKAMKSEIVDAEGRQVGLESLIAADAASRVLRKNGLSPRIVSGGDGHSDNHGGGEYVNRSIDIQAYDADGNNVHLGHVDPQIRKDMVTAAQLSIEGENFRIGVPTDGSNTGMHVQADPDRPAAAWGYQEGSTDYSNATLQRNNPEYIDLIEQNKKLKEEDRQKTLEALIGPTIGEEEPVATASTAESVTLTDPYEGEIVPVGEGDGYALFLPADGGTYLPVSSKDASPEEQAKVIADHKAKLAAETATPVATTPEPPKTATYTMGELTGTGKTPGYNAAAGGAEITDPSMIISEDGKKVTRVAETGPEKLSVMPRHKSSDVFQENQVLMQEARQEKDREEAAKPDIATVKSSPMMSDFGRSRETGQPIAISTVMPRITPSTNKAFADAKMVGRFNKADIDGDMGIVYIDRGYA